VAAPRTMCQAFLDNRENGGNVRLGRESGQAAVETAIVMPLFVFITLGLFQLMLMHQARLMTKYAAYKAVRAGALHRADKTIMEDAALAVLLPVAGAPNSDNVWATYSASKVRDTWNKMKNVKYADKKVAEVTICNPVSGQANAQIDFDDPNPDHAGRYDWSAGQFDRTKLAVQVTFYYRLVIPFANGVLWWMVYGQEHPGLLKVLRTGQVERRTFMAATKTQTYNERETGGRSRTVEDLLGLAQSKRYVLPIRASWTTRMHSNFGDDLPGRNYCQIPWKKKT
jgi:Flp pilus assembly protein TadG